MAGGVVYATAGSIDMNTLIECISFWVSAVAHDP
jgi:hypothetical protein